MSDREMPQLIGAFIHCPRCFADRPPGVSPRDWSRFEFGWTKEGLQVRCVRHNINVIHIDFQGMQHPADLTEYGDFKTNEEPPLDDKDPTID